MDTSSGIYYYKTYRNSRISAVDMNAENLNGEALVCFSLNDAPDIFTHISLAERAKM